MNKKTVLPNGLRVVSHEMKDRDSVALGFWVGVGGRYESKQLKGAAHFLEHIVFKGSEKYSCESIKESIEGVGGTLNAFTDEEQTCFFAKIPSKHLLKTFDVLADMVFSPKIREKDIMKEKTVILEEIKMYHDLPQHYVLELLDGILWPDHPLGQNLAGTPESISNISRNDLVGFYSRAYTPGNIVIAASGDFKHEGIVQLAMKRLGSLNNKKSVGYESITQGQTNAVCKFHKRDIEQMHLALGMLGFDENHEDRYAMTLLGTILGGNMSSRLFVEIREKRGMAYSISASTKCLHDTGLFMIRAGVDNNKIETVLDLILRELEKIKNNGIPLGEFQRAKEYLLGQLLLALEDTMDHMLWIGESVIAKNEIKTLEDIIKKFKKISCGDIKRVARELFQVDSYRLAVVGPLTDKQQKYIQKKMKSGR